MKRPKVTRQHLESVANTMIRYRRTHGYMDFVGKSLKFFDGDPRFDGVGACPVTLEELRQWIKTYDDE